MTISARRRMAISSFHCGFEFFSSRYYRKILMTISAIRRIMLSSFHCGFEFLLFPGLQEDSDDDLCDKTHYAQLLSLRTWADVLPGITGRG